MWYAVHGLVSICLLGHLIHKVVILLNIQGRVLTRKNVMWKDYDEVRLTLIGDML